MNTPFTSTGPGRSRKDFKPKGRFGPVAIFVMIAFHLLLVYGLATGLKGKSVEVVKRTLTATIVQEVKLPPPPPPPPPPPKIAKIEPPRAHVPPPPAYVPPPEVKSLVPAAPAITQVQSTQPVAPPPATPAPTPVPAGPVIANIGVACPKQVKPEVPEKAVDDGISGTVKAEVHIRNGKVADIRFVSGPRVFYSAVRAALEQYECVASGDTDVVATQDFTFQVQ